MANWTGGSGSEGGLLGAFEKAHLANFAARAWACSGCFRTPCGRLWNLQEVIVGWRERISDTWARSMICGEIQRGEVEVFHLELPTGYLGKNSSDHLVSFLEHRFGKLEAEPTSFLGCGDFAVDELVIELGTCSPAKFWLNLTHMNIDHMIIPFSCDYGFVFRPSAKLFRRAYDLMPEPEALAACRQIGSSR